MTKIKDKKLKLKKKKKKKKKKKPFNRLLCSYIFLSRKLEGMVSLTPKLTMSKAPTLRTKGILFSIMASKRELLQAITPPTT
jgi:hypothetical protein